MLGAQPRARTRNEILSPHQRQPLRQSLRVGKWKRMKANPIGTFVRMVCTSRSTTAHHREDNNTTCDEEQTRKIRCHRLFLYEIDQAAACAFGPWDYLRHRSLRNRTSARTLVALPANWNGGSTSGFLQTSLWGKTSQWWKFHFWVYLPFN